MANELMIYEAHQAIARTSGKNYKITPPVGSEVTLKRGTDFGVVPGTKQPSLLKSGAEKVCMAYGLLQHYSIESRIEQSEKNNFLFYYLVKCELVKIANDGKEYVFATGYGSANTAEKRNGTKANSPDVINSTVKMAQKRALVAAALSISGLSDMFTQDMENADFMEKAYDLQKTLDPDSRITAAQVQRIYAIAQSNGIPANEVKMKLKENGYDIKTVTQKEYNAVYALFGAENENK